MNAYNILISIGVFFVIWTIFRLFGLTGSANESKISDRIKKSKIKDLTPQISIIKKNFFSNIGVIQFLMENLHAFKKVRESLLFLNFRLSVSEFLLTSALLGAITYNILIYLESGVPVAILSSCASFCIPFILLSVYKKRYREKFALQLPDSLRMLANTLKVGHTIDAAVTVVASTMPEPTSREFGIVRNELSVGQTLLESLRKMQDRMHNKDLQILTAALSVHRQTGGSLNELIGNLEITIRERFMVRRELKTLSAEGRLSILIMTFLPLVAIIPQFLVDPTGFIRFCTSTSGQYALLIAFLCELIGIIWAVKITDMQIT